MKQLNRLFLLIAMSSFFGACSVQTVGLYDKSSTSDTLAHIGNFYGLEIWNDYLNSEVWYTPDTACLQVQNTFDISDNGNGSLLLSWDKQSGGCEWIGMGIGWDGWSSKNLRDIYPIAAIQFMAKSTGGTLNGLPWAMCLEDYSGGQAWAGVFSSFIEGNKITEEWTKVQVPLTAFDINQFEADVTIVKQLLIQFEADGSVFIDDLKVVELEGGFTKETEVNLIADASGGGSGFNAANWGGPTVDMEGAKVWVSISNTHMYIHAEIEDNSPLMNTREGKDIWNGDALELAFATNPDADPQRKMFFLTDRHIVIRGNDKPIVWDIRKDKAVQAEVETGKIRGGYMIDASIPLTALDAIPFRAGKTYGLEVAVDNGDASGKRVQQYRWNNPGNEGFHNSPAMWGRMEIVTGFSQK